MFIAFEGIDASGKATQSRLLAERLGARLFSFPDYSTTAGILIGMHLKRLWRADWRTEDVGGPLDATVFQSLQLTNRLERAAELIDAASKGHVVADRYLLSAYAYGAADGLDPAWLLRVQRTLPQPDVHILLDIDAKDSVARRPDRRDRYESAGLAFLDRVAGNYRAIFAARPPGMNLVVVDGRKEAGEVTSAVCGLVSALLVGRAAKNFPKQPPGVS